MLRTLTRVLSAGLSRAGWATASTGMTGLTNAVLPLVVQGVAGAAATGSVALALTPYAVGLSVQRALLVPIYLRGVARAPGLATALSTIWSVAAAISVGLILVFGLDPVFLLAAVVTPIALLQDAFRFRAMGVGLSRRAALSDTLWLATFVVVAGVGVATSPAAAVTVVLAAFLIAAATSAVVGLVLWPRGVSSGGDPAHPSVRSLLGEGVVLSGIGALSQPVLAVVAGLEALGLFRIALLSTSVPTFVLSSIQGTVLATLDLTDRVQVRRIARVTSATLGAVATLTLAVCVLVPAGAYADYGLEPRGTFLWCVLLLQIGTVLGGFVTVMMWRARVVARVRDWLGVRIAGSALELVAAGALGWAIGAPGVAAGLLVNNGTVAAGLVRQEASLRRATASSYTSEMDRSHAVRE